MTIKNLNKIIRAYALKNALAHEGKANPGAVVSSLFNEGLEKSNVKEVMPKINEIIKEISGWKTEKQKKEFEKLKEFTSEREIREGLPELPNAEGGVVMRFRPAPSGPLHVGHIISAMPSSLYVEKYGGNFYIIIDDTDPATTRPEAYGNIKKDFDWIFGNVTEYIASSYRMDLYYGYAISLIEKSKAYVCTCTGDKFRELAKKKKNCPCRSKFVKKNILDWEKMIDSNGFNEGEAVLRFKSDMKNPNPAMRDFPLARISLTEHPRQKKKYRVWPLMNLVVSVDDMEFGMTHIIRGKDHGDNAKRQEMIFNVFGKEYPWAFFMGRVKFKDLNLSKRAILKKVEDGEYSGFDDEALPTIASLKKRKFNPEAFAEFAEQRGLTNVDKVMDSKDFFKVIDNFSREITNSKK